MKQTKRDLQYVDPAIRSTIVNRIIFYWAACTLFATLPLIIGTTLANSDQLFFDHLHTLAVRYWPLYVIIFGIIPFAVRDALRTTNRTLGPLSRLKRELKRYKELGVYEPVQCRSDDFLKDLIVNINDAISAHSRESIAGERVAEQSSAPAPCDIADATSMADPVV